MVMERIIIINSNFTHPLLDAFFDEKKQYKMQKNVSAFAGRFYTEIFLFTTFSSSVYPAVADGNQSFGLSTMFS